MSTVPTKLEPGALAGRRAAVTVVARTPGPLAEVQHRLGVATVAGAVAAPGLADRVLAEVQPDILVVNAGLTMPRARLDTMSWETFSAAWEHDVKAGFVWVHAALRHLTRGRVLVMSSGAAMGGSPLSGSYAGAKRMLWIMADDAHACAAELDRDLRFQSIVPMQVVGGTGVGQEASAAYGRRKGITPEAFLAASAPRWRRASSASTSPRCWSIRATPRPAPSPSSPAIARYIELFNGRDWDAVRAMLAADVRLDRVTRAQRRGRREVGEYVASHAIVTDLHLRPASGRQEVIAGFRDPAATAAAYFIELGLRGEEVIHIRDCRYVPYIAVDAALIVTAPAPSGSASGR